MHIGKRIVKNNKAIYETVIDRINNMLDGSETKQIVLFGAGSGGGKYLSLFGGKWLRKNNKMLCGQ